MGHKEKWLIVLCGCGWEVASVPECCFMALCVSGEVPEGGGEIFHCPARFWAVIPLIPQAEHCESSACVALHVGWWF